MERKTELMKGFDGLSEKEKLEIFKVEELESRLEMAAIASSTDGACGNNGACKNKIEIDAGCW